MADGNEGGDERRRRVAAHLRFLAERLVVDDLDDEELARFEERVAAAAAGFDRPRAQHSRFARGFAAAGPAPRADRLPSHPLATGSSAAYPPLDVTYEGDRRLVATTRFGPAWEGPPGLVHGGFLAAGFDMALSTLANHHQGPSVTRWLRVRYLKPTFLGADLRYEIEAGEHQGRLLDLSGVLLADGRVTMRATAQFASLSSGRFADRRTGTGAVDGNPDDAEGEGDGEGG